MLKLTHKIWKKILNADHIVITMHRSPDGDAIGSALCLYNMLVHITKVTLFNISSELPEEFSFLQGFNKIKNRLPVKYDLMICLDSSAFELIGIDKPEVEIINIDHHKSNTDYGTINFVDSSYPSCAEVLFMLLETNNIKLNKPAALCLYTGLVSDTQFFSTQGVNENTFDTAKKLLSFGIKPYNVSKQIKLNNPLSRVRLLGGVFSTFSLFADGMISAVIIDDLMQQKTGATLLDSKHVADGLLALATVEVSIMLFVVNKTDIKVSLRGKGLLDLSIIASKYSGGGHNNAAGIYFKNSDAAEKQQLIINDIKEKLDEQLSV